MFHTTIQVPLAEITAAFGIAASFTKEADFTKESIVAALSQDDPNTSALVTKFQDFLQQRKEISDIFPKQLPGEHIVFPLS